MSAAGGPFRAPEPAASLREDVLAGRFFGPRSGALPRELARFHSEHDDAAALRAWFGEGALAALLRGLDRDAAIARLEEAVDRDVAWLDMLLRRQIDAVLHHPRLTRLEGGWRGLNWLVQGIPPGSRVRVRVLPLRWAELVRDLDRAVEFDHSVMFRRIYEDEFGQPGGEPYGLIAADFEARHAPVAEVATLSSLAGIAAAAFAPTVLACDPTLFGLDTYAEAGPMVDPTDALGLADRAGFRRLQERGDTRFLGLVLPRLLARAPWPDDGVRADGFRYRENAPDAVARVWMSAVYAVAMVAVRAFLRHGWPADMRGAESGTEIGGGVVPAPFWESLPSDPPGEDGPPRPQIEIAFTDTQERQLAEAGFIPLAGLEGLPEAAFAALPSLHRPPRMLNSPVADANQRLSAQFNAILCVSRIAHCLKVMGRDMVGAYRTADEIQVALRDWLGRLTSSMLTGPDTAARYPLMESNVEIREQPGKPGVFGCIMHLRPHYQLDEVGAVFRLVTDIQAPRAAA